MEKYGKILKDDYSVELLRCGCNNCKKVFTDIVPLGFELVRFDISNKESVFLPTYGLNGYLDLLKKIIPEWSESEEITYRIAKLFEQRLNDYTPYKVKFHNRAQCPECESNDITVFDRKIKNKYPINWLEVDRQILN